MPKDRYELEGRTWIPISRAAKLLGTNAQGVRKLMGDGTLDWRQSRANSRTFLVEERGVMTLRAKRASPKLRRSPDPLERKPKVEAPRRSGGGIFHEHHLRLTLPEPEERND
jgi:hypothetical protein